MDAEFKLLPRPKALERKPGAFVLPQAPVVSVGADAKRLAPIIRSEWADEFGATVSTSISEASGHHFGVGRQGAIAPPASRHPEAYRLVVSDEGVTAAANSPQGLLFAWQTLKQMLRHCDEGAIPCLNVDDQPDLRWRIYHVDMKATRRRLSNLHDILPRLAELKINAVLMEYEDSIQLDAYPQLAVDSALSKSDIRKWVAAAADYGISVIPLVQTLGHWQYILGRPEFAHLQEFPGDTTTACPSQPGTWTMARSFLDEIMALHPQAPFIHVGLDETSQLGKCELCQAALDGRPATAMFTDWAQRICGHVTAAGFTPMMWSDMIEPLDREMGEALPSNAMYVDWSYINGDSCHPYVKLHDGAFLSREWTQRPDGPLQYPRELNYQGRPPYLEDMPEDKREALKPYLDNPDYPQQLRTDLRLAWLRELGLDCGGVSGIRVSFHGTIAPKFYLGQMNTRTWAESCREHGASVLIGSSWARGHSFASCNAHPELDWYGIATLADSAWSPLANSEMRAFDERFAFQFFGLPDGRIGDLYYLFDSASPRAHNIMNDFYSLIADECDVLQKNSKRNHDCLTLFAELAALQDLRFRQQFALLEMEYMYQTWDKVPAAFKERMLADINNVESDSIARLPKQTALYAKTLNEADAKELAATQLQFWLDAMLLMKAKLFH